MARKHTNPPEVDTEATPETVAETVTEETVTAEATVETMETTTTENTVMESVAECEAPQTALEVAAEPNFSDAIREGREDARTKAAKLFPALGGLLHKGIYNGVYCVSYGVVFGSLVIGGLIPTHSAVAEGLRDGAKAAREDFETEASPATEGMAPA